MKKAKRKKPQVWQRSQLKLEILKGRAEWLERELKATKKKLSTLKRGKPKVRVRPKKKVRPKRRVRPRPKKKARPTVRELSIETLRARRNKPTKVQKIAELIQKKGYKKRKKDFYKTVDSVLRRHPDVFERAGKATFKLKRKKKKK